MSLFLFFSLYYFSLCFLLFSTFLCSCYLCCFFDLYSCLTGIYQLLDLLWILKSLNMYNVPAVLFVSLFSPNFQSHFFPFSLIHTYPPLSVSYLYVHSLILFSFVFCSLWPGLSNPLLHSISPAYLNLSVVVLPGFPLGPTCGAGGAGKRADIRPECSWNDSVAGCRSGPHLMSPHLWPPSGRCFHHTGTTLLGMLSGAGILPG